MVREGQVGSAYVFDQGHHRVIIVDDYFYALTIQKIDTQCNTTGNYMNPKSAIMKQIKKII